jgi:hypothetical protein
MPQETTVNTYNGTREDNSGRCICNLRLMHKSPIALIDYKCLFECNGANHLNGSVNPCDFYIDCEDYYEQICALKVRAKRKEDKQMVLSEGDNKCLECTGVKNQNCEHYVNVRYVVDEICGHKPRIEKKSRKHLPLIGLENNCAVCIGDKHLERRCNKFYSLKDFREFDVLFDLSRSIS